MKQEKAIYCSTCKEVTVARRDYGIILGPSKWRCGQCGGTKVVDNDPVASTLLREAKILLGKNDEGAVKRLREIIEKYPETRAATLAEKMIRRLGVQPVAPVKNKIIDATVVEQKESKGLSSIIPPAILKRLPIRRSPGDETN